MPTILIYVVLSIPLVGAYAIFALGISMIYRSSRVLNLAQGAMAMVSAYITYSFVQSGIPVLVALVLGIASGAALGVVIERVFVRRLRSQGSTAQTVGTVAATGLLIAFAAKIWGSTPKVAPRVFPDGFVTLGSSGIKYGDIGLFVIAVIVAIALFTFFARTQFGLAMRGAAQNRRAAALMGIDPDVAAAVAWAIGGGLAALSGILLAAVTNLDPYVLSLQALPAFVAALIGGLDNPRGALMGSVIAGLTFGMIPYFSETPVIGAVASLPGAPQLALTILALVVLAVRGRRLSAADDGTGIVSGGGGFRPPSAHRIGRYLLIVGLFVVIWPKLVPFSLLGSSLLAIRNALVAMSLVVMTGWVGQISLGQASFVGISALTTGLIVRGLGIGFPLSMVMAAAAAAFAGVVLGIVALRVRGLYLAVATLIFAWMTDAFLFNTPMMGAALGSSTIPGDLIGEPGAFPTIDLTQRTTLFYVLSIVLGLTFVAMANLRDTKTGRAFFAVRGSEMAAASLGIDVVRTKLIAFAVSGALAGIAGSMLMLDLRTVVPDQFVFTVSLQFLAIAVVGGLGSLGGALAAGVLFAALEEVFFQVPALAGWLEVVAALLLTFVLLVYPGGLAALAAPIRKVFATLRMTVQSSLTSARERTPTEISTQALAEQQIVRAKNLPDSRRFATTVTRLRERARLTGPGVKPTVPTADDWYAEVIARSRPMVEEPVAEATSNGPRAPEDLQRITLQELAREQVLVKSTVEALTVEHVTVRFGGLTAVDDASLAVKQGTVTGLIGPNGAGKTTLFNAILGLNDPASGKILIGGHDATRLGPHLRARLGVARTFQVLQLFTDLSVFDNLLVATHQHNRSGVWSNLAAAPATLKAEAGARDRVREILRLLELEEYADRPAQGLPFGVLRMVELGRSLVTGARLVMLDEPASGLNEAETDKLSEVVRSMRGLGVSVLLIEHDIRMVTGVSDYLFVLDRGQVIAEGTPGEIQRDPHVIAAYLGEPDTKETVVS